ncbi:universal stress protein [Streptomyces sp. S.PB5]|uniref:universal stress protein n=1 Tax=Streptomyces sp. S.PB5 TaxID=3020844 RepID=UPI0025AFA5E4|nr:universal stress protein [Streptomyces sp. S.PB5]MDN3029199.1 universal stress protein [Streptomyces sp. S.PB5]
MTGPVVVGVDGSPSSLAAVEIAAREAARRGVGLRLAHAFGPRPGQVAPGVPPWDPDGGDQRDLVNGALSDAEWRARRVAPRLEITRDVLVGAPSRVLELEVGSASLAVLGSHPRSGLRGLLHGSVAGSLSAQGGCPVLVVCGRPARSGSVVLADDASPAFREAAEFAFAEASERGTDLVVLNTRGTRTARALSALREKYPDVVVHTRRTHRRVGRGLAEASVGAQLVVVGVRRRGHGARVRPRSAGRTALRYAHCPVAVVPGGKA